VAQDPEESGFGISGFSNARNPCHTESRTAKSRGPSDRKGVAREITREYRCGEPKSIGLRGFGVRGLIR
jgi:hypothetical protein